MLQVKSPLRISFCGGGTDVKEFYSKYGGCVVSATINKYVYLSLINNLNKNEIILNYSSLAEKVTDFDQIQHDRFRQCLKMFNVSGVNISSMSDVPFGTGLGSSSAFTVGLIKLLMAYDNKRNHNPYAIFGNKHYDFPCDVKYDIADLACNIEIDKLQTYSGKQDQYASAFGGLNFITFNTDGSVVVSNLLHFISGDKLKELEKHLMLVYIGGVHNSSEILQNQIKTMQFDCNKVAMLKDMCNVTMELKDQLERGNVLFVGEALKENWNIKRSLSDGITNDKIDFIYETAIKHGAYSGKLLGAGGAGFMLFYVSPEKRKCVINCLKNIGLKEFPFKFDIEGARKIITN